MKSDYKEELNKLVQRKKKEIPTSFSEIAVNNIFTILEYTPNYLTSIARHFDDKNAVEPIIEGKRSFRETLIHLLNIEGLHYTTIYPAFLLNKPKIYPIHAERDFDRLRLFSDFQLHELLGAFCLERRKSLSFLKSLNKNDWLRELSEENKARAETIYWRARVLAIHDFTHVQILKFQTNYLE
ncbi:MAG: hypothetical protein SFU99_13605 [Saprospiraceae bacterium]|nr:hypothetical protein [Saprospiraceae bacterium]